MFRFHWFLTCLLITKIVTEINLLEEGDNFASKNLCITETLWVQHNLGDELSVRFSHGQTSEQFLQIVGQIRPTCVCRVHGDENGHVLANFDILTNQFDIDRHPWKIQSIGIFYEHCVKSLW